MTPVISIILPYSKSYQHFLPEALESLDNQTYRDFEIVSDCFDPFLLPQARNILIGRAKGEYLVCLDADDKLAPNYLEKTIALADQNTCVTTKVQTFGSETWSRTFYPNNLRSFLVENQAHAASLYPKSAWEKGGYDEHLRSYEDWEFWIRLAAHGYQFKVADTILYYRRHPESMTATMKQRGIDPFPYIKQKHQRLYDTL